jgi:hypothetical protein
MNLPGELDPGGEIHDVLKAEPDGLDAGFTVTLAAAEATAADDQAQHGVEAWGPLGQGLFGEI